MIVSDEQVEAAFDGFLSVLSIPFDPERPSPRAAIRAALEAANSIPSREEGREPSPKTYEDGLREAAEIALAIDSNRGNEKEIARAIEALVGDARHDE